MLPIRAKTDHRFYSVPKFTKYNTTLKRDQNFYPAPTYNGLRRWQHIALALRKNGPLTFTKLWNKVKKFSGIRSMREMKWVIDKMRAGKLLKVTPPAEGNIKKQRWYYYLPPKKVVWGFKYPEKMERAIPLPNLPFKVFPFEKPTPLNTYRMQTTSFLQEVLERKESIAQAQAKSIAEDYARYAEKKKKARAEKAAAIKNRGKRKAKK